MMNNSDSIFELELQLMKCWEMTDDIRNAADYIYDSPEFIDMPGEYSDTIVNLLFGIEEVYKRRFEKCWGTFESVCKEYHRRGKMAQLDREEIFARFKINICKRFNYFRILLSLYNSIIME